MALGLLGFQTFFFDLGISKWHFGSPIAERLIVSLHNFWKWAQKSRVLWRFIKKPNNIKTSNDNFGNYSV